MALVRTSKEYVEQNLQSYPPLDQFIPAFEQIILYQSRESMISFLQESNIPEDLLEQKEHWDIPYQLILRGDRERLSLLFEWGTPVSTYSEVSVNEERITGLSLLGLAVLEGDLEMIKIILDHAKATSCEPLPDEVFFKTEGEPLSVENILEGLIVYNPEAPAEELRRYDPIIDTERLTDLLNSPELFEQGDNKINISIYHLAHICNCPKEIIDLLKEYQWNYGDAWTTERDPDPTAGFLPHSRRC